MSINLCSELLSIYCEKNFYIDLAFTATEIKYLVIQKQKYFTQALHHTKFQNMERKISICTVCMNRLHHLKMTLPKNLSDNSNYEDLEFVLLDYNSQDRMDMWVKNNLSIHLDSGRLKYYKYPEPIDFNMAHSKNMLGKLGSGEIICIVDADNYTGKDYALYVNSVFSQNSNCFITPISKEKAVSDRSVLGRICFRKSDFNAIEGFDESMNTYGYDDYDLVNRLELLGKKRFILQDERFLKAISHGDDERFKSLLVSRNLENLYVHYINPSISFFLYIFKDKTYNLGLVKNMATIYSSSFDKILNAKKRKNYCLLGQEKWLSGTWQIDKTLSDFNKIKDSASQCVISLHEEQCNTITLSGKLFHKVDDEVSRTLSLKLHPILLNYNKMEFNKRRKSITVNNGIFGTGIVTRNFNHENKIIIR